MGWNVRIIAASAIVAAVTGRAAAAPAAIDLSSQPAQLGLPSNTPPADQVSPASPQGATRGPNATNPEGLSARPGNNAVGDQTFRQTPLPPSTPPRIGLFPETGADILALGIDIHGIGFDHFLADPSAGVQPGNTSNLAAIRPAIDFDLEKLIGVPGGFIHTGFTFFGARSDLPQVISQTGGFLVGFQTTPVVQTNIVSILTYEQKFFNGIFSIEAGRTNAYNYFLISNSLDPFTSFSSTFEIDGDFPTPPYSNWGGRTTLKLSPTWYVQAGAFEDYYHVAINSNPFGTTRAYGAQVLGEIAERSDFRNAAYPSNVEFGVEWNTREGRYNLKGTGAPDLPILDPTGYGGGGVLFLQGLQTLWRGPAREIGPPANIALYGSVDVALDAPQPISLDSIAGVNATGLIPGRPFDAIGVQMHYQRLSQPEVAAESFRQLLLNGPGLRQRASGYAYEVVGNLQITPSIAFRPTVQYFTHPDNYYPAFGINQRPHDGWEAGFFAVISLGRFLGTSVKPN